MRLRVGALVLVGAFAAYGCSDDDGDGTVGPNGGTVSTGGATVVVPAGALDTDVSIGIATAQTGFPSVPSGIAAQGNVFAITPHGQTFTSPVTMTIPHTAAATTGLVLWTADPDDMTWTQVTGATFTASEATAKVSSFSFFVVTAPDATGGDGGTADDSSAPSDS